VFPTPNKSVSITSHTQNERLSSVFAHSEQIKKKVDNATHYYAVNSDISSWQHHMVSDFVPSQAMTM